MNKLDEADCGRKQTYIWIYNIQTLYMSNETSTNFFKFS